MIIISILLTIMGDFLSNAQNENLSIIGWGLVAVKIRDHMLFHGSIYCIPMVMHAVITL